jgi:hypothetical protein
LAVSEAHPAAHTINSPPMPGRATATMADKEAGTTTAPNACSRKFCPIAGMTLLGAGGAYAEIGTARVKPVAAASPSVAGLTSAPGTVKPSKPWAGKRRANRDERGPNTEAFSAANGQALVPRAPVIARGSLAMRLSNEQRSTAATRQRIDDFADHFGGRREHVLDCRDAITGRIHGVVTG